MKIKFIYVALFFICLNTQIKAQKLPVTTTTTHKVGKTALKVNLVQPKTVNFNQNRSVAIYKSQWKHHINGTTEIEFNKNVKINGVNLKAGKYLVLLFPGNDWKPANDAIYAFPGNDWKPKNGNINKFPGNDWNPKDSKIKFPGNDWKPRDSKVKFPGNDWKPVNDSMDSFPGNDWLVVFYRNLGKKSKKFDKSLIAAEITIASTRLVQPHVNLTASFVYLNQNKVNLNISWDKTRISIPIDID